MTRNSKFYYGFLCIIAVLAGIIPLVQAQEEAAALSKGQTLYVPAYSHIYVGNRELPLLLTVTLSIRNVDPRHAVTVTSVEYYGSKGEYLKKYPENELKLGPLEATHCVIPQKDRTGGAGASFLVRWRSDEWANPPLVESVMIGAGGQQGISFTSRAQVINASN